MSDLPRQVNIFMNARLLVPLIMWISQALAADGRPELLSAIDAASPADRPRAVAALWDEVAVRGLPLVESVSDGQERIRVTFLWREPMTEHEPNISLIGSFVPGGVNERVDFSRQPGTDVLYVTLMTDARARYRYYFAWPQGRNSDSRAVWRMPIAGQTYELFDDPRSRHAYMDVDNGVAVRTSYFEGPSAPEEPWLEPRAEVAHGTVDTFEVRSGILNNARRVAVYKPAAYGARAARYPLVILFDREPYLSSVPTPTILDNLIATGALPPLVAVFISAIDDEHRGAELTANPRFASFVVNELLPRVRRDYRVTRDAGETVVAGSSLGGLSAAYIAYQYPKVFGNVLSMSGSYWWTPDDQRAGPGDTKDDWLPRQYAAAAPLPVRFYLAVGLGEGDAMLQPNRRLRDVLSTKGSRFRYHEFHGDHSYLNWRDELVAGLRFLFREACATECT